MLVHLPLRNSFFLVLLIILLKYESSPQAKDAEVVDCEGRLKEDLIGIPFLGEW